MKRPFSRSLLLPQFFAASLGLPERGLLSRLASAKGERDGAGLSGFAAALLGDAALRVSPTDLQRWDLAIGRAEAQIRRARLQHAVLHGDVLATPFVLTHFQWLACLVVEWHLEGLRRQPAFHVAGIEAFRAEHLAELPPYTAEDARKLACFMATGAGKTLVLHMNLLQFRAHRVVEPACTLLLTPNEALSAQHRAELEASGLSDVQVTEITKFYVDAPGAKRPKKGVSEGTSRYEGPNLLLVDEGHKGSGDAKGERGWRDIREALAGGASRAQAGFTFEYSATFAQMADKNPELFAEYARCISIDFGYARFWREGYGKQPYVLNAEQGTASEAALSAGLLAFYQQRRAFAQAPVLAREYLVAAPLLACVGNDVTAGGADSDVAQLVRFLAQACGEPEWLAERIEETLQLAPVQAEIGLPPLDLAWLRGEAQQAGETAESLAADLAVQVFGGPGRLVLRALSDVELGLASSGAPQDAYFGVIRVGKAAKLLDQLVAAGIGERGAPDRLTGSLFARLDHDPKLAVLVGAKMFVEGWSSWRVSSLGLMRVGRSAGSEIVQLFGRGVRLRGKGFSLKRDEAAPPAVRVLQSLQVFGVQASYMELYLKTLAAEGMPALLRHVPIELNQPLAGLGLQTLADDGARFANVVGFDGAALRAHHQRIRAELRAAVGLGPGVSVQVGGQRVAIGPDWLGAEATWQAALDIKRQQGLLGLVFSAQELGRFLARCTVEAPPAWFDDARSGAVRRAQAAQVALQAGLCLAWRDAERRWRMDRLETTALTEDNAGLPWQNLPDGQRRLAWRLELDLARQAEAPLLDAARLQVQQGVRDAGFLSRLASFLSSESVTLGDVANHLIALLDDPAAIKLESLHAPLPRLHVPQHLYDPLLLGQALPGAGEAAPAQQLGLFDEAPLPLRISPAPMNRGEAKFLWDLRAFWLNQGQSAEWQDCELIVLRNPAAGGLLLYRGSGFAPDFMLWLRRGDQQALGLVDPKGLAREWPQAKLDLLQELGERSLSVPVRGFLTTLTVPEDMALPPGLQGTDSASLRAAGVLLQTDDDHIAHVLRSLREALS